jgi:putative nucleotidyltransferase with HDIG domain
MQSGPKVRRSKSALYVQAIGWIGCVLVAISIGRMIGAPPDLRWVALALLTVASAQLTLRMPSVPVTFSVSDMFTFTAALMFGPGPGAVTAAIDAAVLSSRLVQTPRSANRILFNVSAAAIAMAVSSRVFFLLSGAAPFGAEPAAIIDHPIGLAAFALIYFVLNTGFVAIAIALAGPSALWAVWREHFMGLWPGYVGGASAAGLGLFLLSTQHGDVRVLTFVTPIPFILYITSRTAVGRMQDDVAHLTRINSMYLATIETLAQAVDARDEVTHDHLRRVQKNTMRLAQELGVHDERELRGIEAAALLHDIGKLAIPEHILNKPDKLTPAEYEVMKLHARLGAEILSPIEFPFPVVPIVRHHHENWDGSGYPDGLAGEHIPIGARILSVVDCFDALTSDRPYRRAFTVEKAVAIIGERRGVMYDPRVVDALFAIRSEIADGVGASEGSSRALSEAIVHARQAVKHDEPEVPIAAAVVNAAGRLGEIVGRHVDLGALCHAVDDELSLRIPGLTVVIYQHDAHMNALVARATAGVHKDAVQSLTIDVGLRLTGWVAAHRTTIANSEAALDLGNLASQLQPMPQLCFSTPLVTQGRLAGVLTVYSTGARPFTATDVTILEMLGRLLAPRLEREMLVHLRREDGADRGPRAIVMRTAAGYNRSRGG